MEDVLRRGLGIIWTYKRTFTYSFTNVHYRRNIDMMGRGR